jgi:hypothetical protein
MWPMHWATRLAPPLLVLALLFAAPASAAPTCLDARGDTIKCGVPGAMPVGWKPSPQVLWERELSRIPGPTAVEMLAVFCGLGLFFALIALLPDFKGWREDQDDEEE